MSPGQCCVEHGLWSLCRFRTLRHRSHGTHEWFTVLAAGLQAVMERVGSDEGEPSPPGIGAARSSHAGRAAGQLSASQPDATEDAGNLKAGAVSRYETSPPSASAKRALFLCTLTKLRLHMELAEHVGCKRV